MPKKRRPRIESYNINGITARLSILTRWLEEFGPDVVGLQELRCTDEAFPAQAIEALGYSAIWHGQRSWNEVALLSWVGTPVETRCALPGDPNPAPRRYIEAAVCGILPALPKRRLPGARTRERTSLRPLLRADSASSSRSLTAYPAREGQGRRVRRRACR
jgi:hypothetical protein